MKDRYLFRGQRSDNYAKGLKIFVTGSLTFVKGTFAGISTHNDENSMYYPVDEKTICQCTGETDMEGCNIFEYDIVNMDSWSPKEMIIGFIEGAFCLCNLKKFKNTGKLEYTADIHYIQHAGRKQAKIIGNVYEEK